MNGGWFCWTRLLAGIRHDGPFQTMMRRGHGIFLDFLPTIPIRTQNHFPDVEAGFVACVRTLTITREGARHLQISSPPGTVSVIRGADILVLM